MGAVIVGLRFEFCRATRSVFGARGTCSRYIMRPGDIVSINSRKFDGSIRRSWECELLSIDGSQLVFGGEFLEDIDHPELGLIRRGTISRESYWTDRWYNVFQFQEADGNLRNYYCNINMPPVLSERVLDYVDLDIDVVV